MDKTAQGNSNTSYVVHPYWHSNTRSLFFITAIVGTIIAALSGAFVFKTANDQGMKEGWQAMTNAKELPQGKFIDSNPIVYEIAGIISQINTQSIVLEKDGQKKEFGVKFAQFIVLSSPFIYFAEWPTKVVVQNDRSLFFPGDKVTIMINGNELGDTLEATGVMKVQ